jgi:hypothetical protein
MRFMKVVAFVLISAVMALAQKPKQPRAYVPPAPGTHSHGADVPPPVASPSASTAAQLAKIEQQTARMHSNKPVAHSAANGKTTPALDLGRNKPVHGGRPPHRANQNGH